MAALVSAVIPTYNYGRFVGRAIDSVLAQTYAPLECIVVDDGSTDDTPRVLAAYGERIRAIRQENRGLSGARNAGIAAARGSYIALLDADDAWKPRKIARQVATIEGAPDVGVVGCAYEVTDEVHAPRAVGLRPSVPELPGRLRRIALRESWVEASGSGALVPRRVLDEVGPFDEGLRAAEDWDMWLRIAARYRIVNLPEVLVSISQHGTGTFRNPEKMERSQWSVYRASIARWPELLDARTRRRMRALILADAGDEYIGARDYGSALRRYAASLRAWPLDPTRWGVAARLIVRRVQRRS